MGNKRSTQNEEKKKEWILFGMLISQMSVTALRFATWLQSGSIWIFLFFFILSFLINLLFLLLLYHAIFLSTLPSVSSTFQYHLFSSTTEGLDSTTNQSNSLQIALIPAHLKLWTAFLQFFTATLSNYNPRRIIPPQLEQSNFHQKQKKALSG